jgi:hypothetical protein
MSTTLTLELSDTVAEILATPEGLKRAQALLEVAFSDEEDGDPAVWVEPPGDLSISENEARKMRDLIHSEDIPEPTEALKQAIRHWQYLKGAGPDMSVPIVHK